MVDHKLVVAEARAGELLTALTEIVHGWPGAVKRARLLLAEIEQLHLPEWCADHMREQDARRRALEFADDVVREYHANA